MNKNICIFLSRSSMPDLYVNVIVYLIARFKPIAIQGIYLINVYDYPLDFGKASDRSEKVKTNIKRQIKALAEKSYFRWNRESGDFFDQAEEIEVDNYFQRIYQQSFETLESVKFEAYTLLDLELEQEIVRIVQANFGEYIFDLTGLVKKYFVSVALFLQENSYDYSTFEVVEHNFKYDDRDLIHNLKKIYLNYSVLNSKKYKVVRSAMSEEYKEGKNRLAENKLKIWKQKLAKGEMDKVLEEIHVYLEKTNSLRFEEPFLAISKRYHDNKNSLLNNSIKEEDYKVEEGKLMTEILRLVDKVVHKWN